ncbi:Phosphate ABC transporter, periplasmic phosphate-binding protein PstS [Vibrio parahaemolyticus]|nr:Phosphate ABC transporter, periplasmic phosphate-binding protein PstS [Vibrio parahaemolyticus]
MLARLRTNIVSGKYPLSRYLYVYVNKHPDYPLSPNRSRVYSFYVLCSGQALVEKDGYVPITADFAAEELKKVGL